MEKYLVRFLEDEVHKTGLKNVVLGLSGGIDSAVVAVLAKKAFGDRMLCVMMPSHFSSNSSVEDAIELCEKFDIRYEIRSIEEPLKAFIEAEEMNNLRIGNISARLRMITLYDLSAKEHALVVGTSNKSELLLGYGTLFGDLASALNPIGDIYKSDLFGFAEHIGVTVAICTKPPSADLWAGQSDEEEIGYTYPEIDAVLEDFVDRRLSEEELHEKAYNKDLIKLVVDRVYKNHFKRKPPIIAKLTSRTIGIDFLYPRDINL
jgi:NAD+ synthase